jgi:galactose mutarotase-like enzyme
VTLASLRGTATSQSAIFHLRDQNTRLRYRSSGTSLVVYVVDAHRGLDATAGYADAECAGACAESWMPLTDRPNDYYLLVRGTGGSWAVEIAEHP